MFTYASAIHPKRPLGLIVFESRPTRQEDNADRAVYRNLVQAGLVDKSIAVYWTKTADEHLLWVADTTASAYRQLIARSQPELWRIVEPSARVIKTKPMVSPLQASQDLSSRLNAARAAARARAAAAASQPPHAGEGPIRLPPSVITPRPARNEHGRDIE